MEMKGCIYSYHNLTVLTVRTEDQDVLFQVSGESQNVDKDIDFQFHTGKDFISMLSERYPDIEDFVATMYSLYSIATTKDLFSFS